MVIELREFRVEDEPRIAALMDEFQNYLIGIDDLKRLVAFKDAGVQYTKIKIEDIKKVNGVMFIATAEQKIIGFVFGMLEPLTEIETLEIGNRKYGTVTDIFVTAKHRNQGVGKMLLEKIEQYFKSVGCDTVSIGMLACNVDAHNMYAHMGYTNRSVDMIKIL